MFHPKIGCFNFKPQYLLNYTSPTNYLYSVRKRSIGAFKSIFKLLGLGPASAGPLRAKFFARNSPLACGFAALAPNFAPKLCTRRVSAWFSACSKTCWGRFDPMLIPVERGTNENWENGKSAHIFLLIFSPHFLDFGDITSIFREKAPNAMQYCLKLLIKGLLYHTISWCVKNLQKLNVPNLAHWPS